MVQSRVSSAKRRSYNKLCRKSQCRRKPPRSCSVLSSCKYASGNVRKFCRKKKNTKHTQSFVNRTRKKRAKSAPPVMGPLRRSARLMARV